MLVASLLVPALAAADVKDKDTWCDESRGHDDARHRFCEVREYTLAAPRGGLSVDAGMNGGIKVAAWDRDEVLVQAKVEVWADSPEEAAEVGGGIRVTTAGGRIEATGPDGAGNGWRWGKRARQSLGWGVSFHIHVPRRMDLALETHNGGISVAGVSGRITLEALNGALALRDAGGDVTGRTTNGSLNVDLEGDRWKGEGLDLVTTNGSVTLRIPESYSARLETGTTNGRMSVDPSLELDAHDGEVADRSRDGRRGGRLRVELGRNGAPIRAVTTNGSVKVARAE